MLFQNRERIKVLDFACGFGRLIRFLVLEQGRDRIWGAEIQQEALEFVASRFVVRCLNSCPDPSAFDCEESFDIIWVASLFSHLPESLFHQWLRVLFSLLRPGGVLAFSTKPLATAAPTQIRSEPGFVYTTESECRELDSCIYGTACVDDAFVRDAIERVTGPGHPVFHMPRALANEQDLHVVPCNRDHDLTVLRNVRKGVAGWLDRCSLAAGELSLEGWAASLDEGPAQTIEIVIDGQRHSVIPGISRPDVAEAFADERLERCGWKFRETLTGEPQEIRIHVSAQSAGGSRAMIYFGCVQHESQ
ncbi:MAG: class I SAM-dependent methyltransferase [Rhodanobacteraceae bacterium]